MSGKEYKVTIKSANQKTDDYVATCHSEWTIYKLKQHIAATHVNKPSVEDQRLIYAGRLLNDSHILRQVFFRDSLCTDQSPDKSDFTIHLVCAQRQQIPNVSANLQISNQTTVGAASTQSQNRLSTSFVHPPNSMNQQPDLILNNLSRQRQTNINNLVNPMYSYSPSNISNGTTENANSSTANSPSGLAPNIARVNIFSGMSSGRTMITRNSYLSNFIHGPNTTLDVQTQQALFQQMAQLVASQINQLTTGGTGSVPIGLSPQTTSIMRTGMHSFSSIPPHHSIGAQLNPDPFHDRHNHHDVNNDNGANIEQQANRDQIEPQIRDAGPNIDQARPIQPNENLDEQRNILNWLCHTFRALALMSLIYVHSSYKFLLIIGIIAFCYFYKNSIANRRIQQAAARRVDDVRDIDGNGGNDELRNRARSGSAPQSMQPDLNRAQDEQEARLPFFKMLFLMISSFIISLIPENNHV